MTEKGRCSAITGSGGRCRGIAIRGSDYCHAHHPDRAEARSRAASRAGKTGGRGRPGSGRLASVDQTLNDMIAGVLDGSVKTGEAAVVIQACNGRIRLTTAEMQIHEQQVVEQRLDELEARLEQAKAERGYGGGYA